MVYCNDFIGLFRDIAVDHVTTPLAPGDGVTVRRVDRPRADIPMYHRTRFCRLAGSLLYACMVFVV
jgi:hypothetical protein